MLVVIAILGILAAVVVFAVGGVNNTSQNSACAADRTAMQNAQEAYYGQNHAYATNGAALVAANFLRSDSQWYQTDSSGAVTPIANNSGHCT
ncbi:MAG: type II secretion system protein [Actinobacteria bacterium]|nr:type II secretion system protein [Actinomycetota bacterium]